MKYLVVTSWSPDGERTYGQTWIDGFKKFWPANAAAKVVTDADIYADPDGAKFFARNASKKAVPGAEYNYRLDYYRFAHKVYAISIALKSARQMGVKWLVWLDGDVVTKRTIDESVLASWLPDTVDVAYLSRKETWDHPECGFFGVNLSTEAGNKFIDEFVNLWNTDAVLSMKEYHDSHVFGELIKAMTLNTHDLCPRSAGLNAFLPSPLGEYLDHRKGARKAEYAHPDAPKMGTKQEVDDLTGGAFGGNVILRTRNCRPESEIRDNIRANLEIVKNWLMPARSHSTPLILVSAGESLKEERWLNEIRDLQDSGASVWCVKHSLQTLLDNGIVPWACVLLDPRPHKGPSTHGFPRESMLQNVGAKIKIFAASMCDPSVTRDLVDRGADVWGWHAAVGANERELVPKSHPLVPGGSTSVMRAFSIGWMLGFRHIITYAMDSCHFNPEKLNHDLKNPDGTPKYFPIEVGVGDMKRTFWTDRDLLAQAQDFARVLKENPMLELEARGPGMVPFMWEGQRGRFSRPFKEVYGFAPS